MADVWPMAVATFLGSIALAVIFLYAYDKPVRRCLSRKNKATLDLEKFEKHYAK